MCVQLMQNEVVMFKSANAADRAVMLVQSTRLGRVKYTFWGEWTGIFKLVRLMIVPLGRRFELYAVRLI